MEITDKELALIDKYLREEISDSDMGSWHTAMSDSQFKQAFEERRELANGVISDGREQLRDRMKGWSQEVVSSPGKRNTIWYSAVAAVAILLVSAIFILRNSGDDSLAYEEPFPDILSEVTRSQSNTKRPYEELMGPYNRRRWNKAEEKFTDYLQQNPEDFGIWMYGGIASYLAGNYDRSLLQLEKVPLLTIDETFVQPALWFEILALVRLEENKRAKVKIKQLLATNHYKREEAQMLFDEL